jgi:metal-dependent hydrolase (beta-lactamase superfamily II)
MESTGFSVIDAESVTVWVITDNYYDASRTDTEFAKRYRSSPGKCIHSEHGLAFYIETWANGKTGACMFDFGMDPLGVINNMDLLGIDVENADAFGLSHGHFDHFMGAVEILNRNREKISNTITDIQSINPDIIAPLHCTGYEAVTAFWEAMPDSFILNTAGTKYTFKA